MYYLFCCTNRVDLRVSRNTKINKTHPTEEFGVKVSIKDVSNHNTMKGERCHSKANYWCFRKASLGVINFARGVSSGFIKETVIKGVLRFKQ